MIFGSIGNISETFGKISISMKTNDFISGVSCSMAESETNKVAQLSKGQVVSLIGIVDGLLLGISVSLDNCMILAEEDEKIIASHNLNYAFYACKSYIQQTITESYSKENETPPMLQFPEEPTSSIFTYQGQVYELKFAVVVGSAGTTQMNFDCTVQNVLNDPNNPNSWKLIHVETSDKK